MESTQCGMYVKHKQDVEGDHVEVFSHYICLCRNMLLLSYGVEPAIGTFNSENCNTFRKMLYTLMMDKTSDSNNNGPMTLWSINDILEVSLISKTIITTYQIIHIIPLL